MVKCETRMGTRVIDRYVRVDQFLAIRVLPAQQIFPGVGIAPWTLFNSSDLDSEGINQGSPVLEKEMIGLSVDWETTKTQR